MKLPKGKVLIIGGAEHKSDGRALSMEEYNKDFEILKGLLPAKKAHIVFFTGGSQFRISTIISLQRKDKFSYATNPDKEHEF